MKTFHTQQMKHSAFERRLGVFDEIVLNCNEGKSLSWLFKVVAVFRHFSTKISPSRSCNTHVFLPYILNIGFFPYILKKKKKL